MHKAWKKYQNTVYWVDIILALKKGLKFDQVRSNASILHETLPAYCIPKVIRMETGEVSYEKVFMSPRPPPKISLKHEWKRELGSEVVDNQTVKLLDNQKEKLLDKQKVPNQANQGRPHGHKYGKTKEQRDYHVAHNLRKRCIKRRFKGIQDRFLKDPEFCESQLEHDRYEEVCIQRWMSLREKISDII